MIKYLDAITLCQLCGLPMGSEPAHMQMYHGVRSTSVRVKLSKAELIERGEKRLGIKYFIVPERVDSKIGRMKTQIQELLAQTQDKEKQDELVSMLGELQLMEEQTCK